MMAVFNLSRRSFLKGTSGLVLGFFLPGCHSVVPKMDDDATAEGPIPKGKDTDITAWVAISVDEVITLRVGASEMGQGVLTALPMILAEELDVPWSKVRAESAPADDAFKHPNVEFPGTNQGTFASVSVRGHYDMLREAGATARQMLIETAAERWQVKPSQCQTNNGAVTCANLSATYGELAVVAATRKQPKDVPLKAAKDFKLIGTSPMRLDMNSKSTGQARFGIDVEAEGSLVATIKACPHFGGSLKSFDGSKALAMDGVHDVFQVGQAVAVVADGFWQAKKARDVLEISWNAGEGKGLNDKSLRDTFIKALDEDADIISENGELTPHTMEALYEVPYLAHAPMEPPNCTVKIGADRCDVWVGTQAQSTTKKKVAEWTGLSEDSVHIHTTYLGGGFGRRSETDHTEQAVKIALKAGKPVKLIWTREETFTHGFYRPASVCRMRATLTNNKWAAWQVGISSQSIMARLLPGIMTHFAFSSAAIHHGLSDMPYALDAKQVQCSQVTLPIPVGWWRSVHGSHAGFFRECFLDEVAVELKVDAVQLRRQLLSDHPRQVAVLDLAVSKAPPLGAGQSRGVALFESYGSICAEVVDLTVQGGEVRVHHVTASIDCGQVIHPDTVRAQVMGAALMGISSAIGEGLSFEDGAVTQNNFHQYPVLKMAQSPTVDVHIVPSKEKPGGVGEPGLPPAPAALCNAIFQATGKRIRRLPIADQLKDV